MAADGSVIIDTRMDTSCLLYTSNKFRRDFINSLGENWVRIPAELVDETTEQNFISYARA